MKNQKVLHISSHDITKTNYDNINAEDLAQRTVNIGKKWKSFNSFSVNFTKWPNTLKQFLGNLPTNCLSVFDHFVGLALEGLILTTLQFHPFK